MGKKTKSHYSEEFKLRVVKEVLEGKYSKEEARRIYGIKSNCAILYWIRQFSGQSNYREGGISQLDLSDLMKKKQTVKTSASKNLKKSYAERSCVQNFGRKWLILQRMNSISTLEKSMEPSSLCGKIRPGFYGNGKRTLRTTWL